MIRIASALVALVLVFAGMAPAGAATLGEARVGFTAERILVLNGRRFVGRIWQMPGEQRHEQALQGFTPAFILHAASPVADVVVPQIHTVVELPLPRELLLLDHRDLLGKSIGHQQIDGIAATEYAVDRSSPEGQAHGTIWLSEDRIPIKADGTFTSKSGRVATVHWMLRHVEIGPQPAALFEPPAGYSHLPAEAVAPLLGLRIKHAKD